MTLATATPPVNPTSRTTAASQEDLKWLISPAAAEFLQLAGAGAASPALVARLRRQLSEARAQLVLQLALTREQGSGKICPRQRDVLRSTPLRTSNQ